VDVLVHGNGSAVEFPLAARSRPFIRESRQLVKRRWPAPIKGVSMRDSRYWARRMLRTLTCEEDAIQEIDVVLTMVGGRIVHR